MRYRRLDYRYTMIRFGTWPLAPMSWAQGIASPYPEEARWRPDADMCETARAIVVVVDLAGVGEDEVEIQLFDNALVVKGQRSLPGCDASSVYHAVGVRQGPFRLELPLPAAVDAEAVEVRYERGLLRITLGKREGRS
jgi:HSP20 family molecular chaperone IbpA